MGHYRKKPVVIEAVQLLEENEEEILRFLREHSVPFEITGRMEMEIRTLEGTMRADPRDWLIRGVAGEIYPCKPDIFEATYEPVAGVETTATRGPAVIH